MCKKKKKAILSKNSMVSFMFGKNNLVKLHENMQRQKTNLYDNELKKKHKIEMNLFPIK